MLETASERLMGRGFHSCTSQLNLSRVCHKKTPYTPYTPPNTPLTRATQPLHAPPIPYKALKLSRIVEECKPLLMGPGMPHEGCESKRPAARLRTTVGRCRLNLSNPR